MGGGSMNAATILSFFFKKGILNLRQAKIYANSVSSSEKVESFLDTARKEITDPKLKEIFEKIIDE